jgi:hypoxanthine phosphoribosyltransferase
MSKEVIKWVDFLKLSNKLYKKLTLKNFDGLISIGRGGTIIGSILASKLGTRIHPVFVVHTGKGSEKTTRIVELGVTSALSDGRYLLVDDKCYTGQTFDLLKKNLTDLKLETAALICHGNNYQPNYYALNVNKEIILPYEFP